MCIFTRMFFGTLIGACVGQRLLFFTFLKQHLWFLLAKLHLDIQTSRRPFSGRFHLSV